MIQSGLTTSELTTSRQYWGRQYIQLPIHFFVVFFPFFKSLFKQGLMKWKIVHTIACLSFDPGIEFKRFRFIEHEAAPIWKVWLRRKHSFWKNAFHLRTKEACVPRKLSDFSLGSVHRDVYHIFPLFPFSLSFSVSNNAGNLLKFCWLASQSLRLISN